MDKKDEFVEMIKENEGIIFKISTVYSVSIEDQKDLYQEIIYQLWNSYASFQGKSKRSTWIYRVALNTSITHMNRRKRRILPFNQDVDEIQNLDASDSFKKEQIDLLHRHIKNLSIVEKGIILLYLDNHSYDEIAEITGFTSTNIGTRLSRIKAKLKASITNNYLWKLKK